MTHPIRRLRADQVPTVLVLAIAAVVLAVALAGCGGTSATPAQTVPLLPSSPVSAQAGGISAGGATGADSTTGGGTASGSVAAPGSAASAASAGSAGSVPGSAHGSAHRPGKGSPAGPGHSGHSAHHQPGSTGSAPGDPSGGSSAGTDPSSPFVVAAAAVGTRSRVQVQQLHAMAVSTTRDGSSFPRDQIAGVGAGVQQQLRSELSDMTMATPPAGSPAARLAAALQGYIGLAGRVAAWQAAAGKPLPASFFTDLAAADTAWKSALRQVGALAGQDLLAGLPDLVMPQ
jgi:hypothetical protein